MRYKILYDGKEKYTLASFPEKEQACAYISRAEAMTLALYPTLSADIGILAHSPLWGRNVRPEALRAASFYLGALAGWPMQEITVLCDDEKIIPLPLIHDPNDKIPQKIKFCKQLFENITVFTSSVSHKAVKFSAPFEFVLIESKEVDAVDLLAAEGMRSADDAAFGLPICFASLSGCEMKLRACQSGRGSFAADDVMYMLALAYFCKRGSAEMGRSYFAAGGEYRVDGREAVSLRSLCEAKAPI